MKKKAPIDPFEKRAITKYNEDELPDTKKRDVDEGKQLSYLEKFRLNLVVTLGSPWRVKYDLIERNIAILNMIEEDNDLLHDSKWMYVYERISSSAQRELEKLDTVWKDMNTKRSSQEQLKAFQNIELFIEFLSNIGDKIGQGNIDIKNFYGDELIRLFVEFLKEKDLFVE